MDGSRLGLALLSMAGFAWLVYASWGEANFYAMSAFLLVGGGFFLASREVEGRGALGLVAGACVLAGWTMFFYEVSWPWDGVSWYVVANGAFLVGVVELIATFARPSGRRALGLFVAGAIFALAAALWIPLDAASGGYGWEFGNVLALVGGALLAWSNRLAVIKSPRLE